MIRVRPSSGASPYFFLLFAPARDTLPWLLMLALAGLLPAAGRTADAPEEIRVERILGPEAPGKYKPPAAITELRGGDLYIVYHAGTGEYSDDTAVWCTRRPAGASAWEAPKPVADTPFHGDGNAVIWQAPDELVWLFYVVRYGPTWSSSRIHAKVSRDGARTWSDAVILTFEAGTMVRGKPIVLSSGDYLLPIYHEVGDDPEQVSKDCTSAFLVHDVKDAGRWRETGRIRSRIGNIQPAPAELSPGRLVAYCRRGGDYNPTKDGWIVRSESSDGGRTWSEGSDSRFPNPNAAVDLLRLANGHLVLVYNDSMSERTPLTVAVSSDSDKTYPHRRNIAEGPGDFGYPYAIQTADGKIHVVYTSDERTVVRHAVFDEATILRAPKE